MVLLLLVVVHQFSGTREKVLFAGSIRKLLPPCLHTLTHSGPKGKTDRAVLLYVQNFSVFRFSFFRQDLAELPIRVQTPTTPHSDLMRTEASGRVCYMQSLQELTIGRFYIYVLYYNMNFIRDINTKLFASFVPG